MYGLKMYLNIGITCRTRFLSKYPNRNNFKYYYLSVQNTSVKLRYIPSDIKRTLIGIIDKKQSYRSYINIGIHYLCVCHKEQVFMCP
jgi:hypothetical protein